MHVTIAICTWNRASLLEQTLSGLTKMQVPPDVTWSLLVVDNNCNDHTQSVLRSFSDRLPLTSVCEATPGLSVARNRALAEATGDYVLWTDDDVQVDESWLSEFAATARRHPLAAAIGGRIEPWFVEEPDPDLADVYPWLRSGFCGMDLDRPEGPLPEGMHLTGANFGLRRAAVAGRTFHLHLGTRPGGGGGEDTEFIASLQSAGAEVIWSPGMLVRHYVDPRRMRLDYLDEYTYHRGRQVALLQGLGVREEQRGRVPRWIYREWLHAATAYWLRHLLALTPPQRLRSGLRPRRRSRRINQLTWQREYQYLRGVVRGCLEADRFVDHRAVAP